MYRIIASTTYSLTTCIGNIYLVTIGLGVYRFTVLKAQKVYRFTVHGVYRFTV